MLEAAKQVDGGSGVLLVGIGIHGEPGCERIVLKTVDEITETKSAINY